jgi:hypothetical protein
MTVLMKPTLDVRAIYEQVIERLLNGDMKGRKNSRGWTYVEQLAHDMFLHPKMAAKLTAMARLPAVKASVERALALNAPKQAIMDRAERIKKRGEYDRRGYYEARGCRERGDLYEDGARSRYRKPEEPMFYLDLPFRLQPLDKRHGPHVFLPLHRKYKLLGTDRNDHVRDYDDHADLAWHFRRDPREIAGAWSPKQDYYVYTMSDYGNSLKNEKPFLNEYRRRLRVLLAEAVPGVGGLSLEPEW